MALKGFKSMHRTRHHALFTAVASFLGVIAGCGSPDAATTDVSEFQGTVPAESLGAEADVAASPDEAVDTSPAEVGSTNENGVGEAITLQPSEGEAAQPEADDGAPPAPVGMDPDAQEPEVVVPAGPPPKFVGNITTGNSLDTNGLTFSDYWDQITPENAGKWGSVQRTAGGAFNWGALDAIYDYAEQKGIIFKEHTLVWGSQQPTGDLTQADVETWMRELCSRYPRTRLIDVVNEPPPHTEPSYANAIGGGTNGDWRWIANAFTWAREYCPNATLILNDFNNIESGNQNQHFIDIVQAIQKLGAPIDAVGAQAHGLSGANSPANMIALLTKLHGDTGLPVYITEYDIDQNDDATQRSRFEQQLGFFLDTEWIQGVTVWGWIYGRTWVPSSGLIRDGAARPAMVWLMDELGRPLPQ
jgi:endo-1,4-beta-xylanase